MLLTSFSPGLRSIAGGSRRKVSALLSCRKQKLRSASIGEVFRIVSFSMFSGYFPSLYLFRREINMFISYTASNIPEGNIYFLKEIYIVKFP